MKPVLLLHGAIGSKTQLEPLRKLLQNDYEVYSINFSGHGGEPLPLQFSIELFALEVVKWLEQNHLDSVRIFGYSMGGYVALYLAAHYPEKVEAVITLATKFDWNEQTSAKEVSMLQPDVIEKKLPTFAQQLQQRHEPGDWKIVLQKTAAMLLEMGVANPLKENDFSNISCPVQLLLGDRDKMITLEETVSVYKKLPVAQLGVLPATPHPIEMIDPQLLSFFVKRFFV